MEGVTRRSTRIHQIYYRKEQRRNLDPSFLPYDNASDRPRYEYDVFLDEADRVQQDDAITGFLSWKFQEKTGLTGLDFMEFIDSNPDRDVYFINPYPENLAWKNVWWQSTRHHPKLRPLAKIIVGRAHPTLDLDSIDNNHDTLLFCNYWVGTPAFWRDYMDFLRPIVEVTRTGLSDDESSTLLSIADPVIRCDHRPLLFERIFSTYLGITKVRAAAYGYPLEALRQRYGTEAGSLIAELQNAPSETTRRRLYETLKLNQKDPLAWQIKEALLRTRAGHFARSLARRPRETG